MASVVESGNQFSLAHQTLRKHVPMNLTMRWWMPLLLIALWIGSLARAADAPPKEWIDPDTGHRVVRLSDEPDSRSLYFHQNAYSPDGRKLTFSSPTGVYQVDLQTRQIDRIIGEQTGQYTQGNSAVRVNLICVGRKTGQIYYSMRADQTVWRIDPRTKETHKIGQLPDYDGAGRAIAGVGTVNADETRLAGTITYLDGRGGAATNPVTAAPGQRINLAERWAQHLPMQLITMDIQTGEIKRFNSDTNWLNHVQYSPTDPHLIMFCHEGPWQNNDRVWTIRDDGTGLFQVHHRTMINEIWGHEFWSADGNTIWFDLATPRGMGAVGWLAGYKLQTGERIHYHRQPVESSIHYNVSRDGSLFCGDGGRNGAWIYLFHPHMARNMAAGVYDAKGLIQPGYWESERLVNMSEHDYTLEPNVSFTPDMKWVVFRSNMFGPSYVFAVEVAKAQ